MAPVAPTRRRLAAAGFAAAALLALVLIALARDVTALSVTEATIEVRSGSVLGGRQSLALLNVDFDGDLYRRRAIKYCPDEPPVNTVDANCPPCDYSRAATCGTRPNALSTSCAACDANLLFLCDGSTPGVVSLESNVTSGWNHVGALQPVFMTYYRADPARITEFYQRAAWSDIDIFITPLPSSGITDYASLQSYYYDNYYTNFAFRSLSSNPERVAVCPSSTAGVAGTFLVVSSSYTEIVTGSYKFNVGGNFTVTAYDFDAAVWDMPAAGPACTPLVDEGSATCLRLNEPLVGETPDPDLKESNYSLVLPASAQCSTLTFVATADVDTAPADYGWTLTINGPWRVAGDTYLTTGATQADYMAYNSWGEPVTFVVCPGDQQLVFRWSVKPGSLSPFTVLVTDTTAPFHVERLIDTDPGYIETELKYGSVRFTCDGQQPFFCDTTVSQPGVSGIDCTAYAHRYPRADNDTQVFWPRPAWTNYNDRFRYRNLKNYEEYSGAAGASNRYSGVALLSLDLDNTLVRFYTGENGTADYLTQHCTLRFTGGRLVDQAGQPLLMSVGPGNWTVRTPKCRRTPLNDQLDGVEQLYASATNTSLAAADINDWRMQLDIVTLDQDLYSCQSGADDLLRSGAVTRTLFTDQCTLDPLDPAFASDPCCSPGTADWERTCVDRTVQVTSSLFNGYRSRAVNDRCDTPLCMRSYLSDYSSLRRLQTDVVQGCDIAVPPARVLTIDSQTEYRACRYRYYGADNVAGVPCRLDADCQPVFPAGSNATCNMIDGRCVVDNAVRNRAFVRCLVDQLDGVILSAIADAAGVGGTTYNRYLQPDQYTDALYQSLLGNGCSRAGTTDPDVQASSAIVLQPGIVGCVACNQPIVGLDSYITTAYACQTLLTSLCAKLTVANGVSGQTACEALTYCPNPDGTAANCASQSAVCLLCEDPSAPCVKLPSVTQTDCENAAGVCVLPGGAVDDTALTQSTCGDAQGSCTAPCFNPDGSTRACTSQAECVLSGRCYDVEDPFHEEASSIFGVIAGNTGACIFATSPFFAVGCDSQPGRSAQSYATQLGCLDPTVTSATACAAASGTWVPPPQTQAECQALGSGCYQQALGSNTRNLFMWSPKNETECPASIGTYQASLFAWEAGVWQPGVLRPMQWFDPAATNLVRQQGVWGMSMQLPTLAGYLGSAIEERTALLSITESECLYSRYPTLMSVTACDCLSSGSHCFRGVDNSADAGAGRACRGGGETPQSLAAPPAILKFSNTSVPEALDCIDFALDRVSALEYRVPKKVLLTTTFVDLVYRAKGTDYFFKNHNGAIIGQVLGDGVIVDFAARPSGVSYRLCLELTLDRKRHQFPQYDLAAITRNHHDRPRPLRLNNLSTSEEPGYLCGTVQLSNSTSARSTYGYIPVARVRGNFNDKQPDFLSPGEQAILILTGCFFFFVSLYAASMIPLTLLLASNTVALSGLCWKCRPRLRFLRWSWTAENGMHKLEGDEWKFKWMPWEFHHNVFWLLFLFTIVRAAFFISLGAKAFDDSINPVGLYIFTELPTFFYFSAFTFFILLWALVGFRLNKNRVRAWIAKGVFLLINLMMWTFFLLVILLLAFLPKPNTNTEKQCGRQVNKSAPYWSNQRILLFVYGLVLALMSLAIAVGFLISGIRIFHLLHKVRDLVGMKKKSIKVFVLAALCSLTFLIRAAEIPALIAANWTNSYFASVFAWFFEIIPAIIMIFIIRPTSYDAAPSGTTSTGGSGVSGSDRPTTSSTDEGFDNTSSDSSSSSSHESKPHSTNASRRASVARSVPISDNSDSGSDSGGGGGGGGDGLARDDSGSSASRGGGGGGTARKPTLSAASSVTSSASSADLSGDLGDL